MLSLQDGIFFHSILSDFKVEELNHQNNSEIFSKVVFQFASC